ncbi:hypothetical protein H4Q26_014754 [Puccinia striiformis f. sp. tritici PST-130]|nr:hypothetical protein H4Q26_014754 [Puccinia striiformis f. sp. tritici PST-130]
MANFMRVMFSPSNSRQSSAPSPESDIKLSPRQRQITSETSSCPSDNEISSLYGKYRNSGYSINENFEQDQQQDDSEIQGNIHSLKGTMQTVYRLDGRAIDSAQTTFGNPEEITSETQDQLSDVRSYSPLVNGLDRLSIDKGRNLHTPEGIRPGEHSAEDLSEPITASSLSDYSADESEDLQGAKDAFTTWSIQLLPALSMRHSNTPTRPMTWMLLQNRGQLAVSRPFKNHQSIQQGVHRKRDLDWSPVNFFRRSSIYISHRGFPHPTAPPFAISQARSSRHESKAARLGLASKQDALRETRQSTSSSHPQRSSRSIPRRS